MLSDVGIDWPSLLRNWHNECRAPYWARILGSEEVLKIHTCEKWHGWTPSMGSTCSGLNVTRVGLTIWRDALGGHCQINSAFLLGFSIDTAGKCANFLELCSESLTHKKWEELPSGSAERWFPPAGGPIKETMPKLHVPFVGVDCRGALSNKNKHVKTNLSNNANKTNTQWTMHAVCNMSSSQNGTLQLTCVENVNTFVGPAAAGASNSCYREMCGEYAQTKPMSFESIQDQFGIEQHFEEPTTPVRSHM